MKGHTEVIISTPSIFTITGVLLAIVTKAASAGTIEGGRTALCLRWSWEEEHWEASR